VVKPVILKMLFNSISSLESLVKAFDLAKLGNRHKNYAIEYEFYLEQNLSRLSWELRTGNYQPGPYHHFLISCPKLRAIAAPAFRDRVVQQSLVSVINPIFEKTFIFDSYACRKDKGTHFGARRVKKFLQTACSLNPDQEVYALQADINKFFASMSWSILQKLVAKKISDKQTLKLVSQFITEHRISITSTQSQEAINKVINIHQKQGLPIGNLTSQLFANVYLNQLDHFVKERLGQRWYARYMDDFLIIHPSKDKLHEIKNSIAHFLSQELKLNLHSKKTVVYPVKNGVPFVGYRIFYNHTLVRGDSLLRMQRRLKKRRSQLESHKITQKKFQQSISSFKGHLQHADSYWLQKSLFKKSDV
jgi:RNA-directed DNA polymerase